MIVDGSAGGVDRFPPELQAPEFLYFYQMQEVRNPDNIGGSLLAIDPPISPSPMKPIRFVVIVCSRLSADTAYIKIFYHFKV